MHGQQEYRSHCPSVLGTHEAATQTTHLVLWHSLQERHEGVGINSRGNKAVTGLNHKAYEEQLRDLVFRLEKRRFRGDPTIIYNHLKRGCK